MNIVRSVLTSVIALTASCSFAANYGLETLDLGYVEQGWGSAQANKSVDGHALSIGGKKFEHGLGTHAASSFRISLNGKAERFHASVGIDDEVGKLGSVVFRVTGDGKTLWDSGILNGGDPAKEVSVDLHGVKMLLLSVGVAGDNMNYDHADWAEAVIEMTEGKPEAAMPPREPAVALTPKQSPKPRINGAKVVGMRPGAPFLFTIPVSGQQPVNYTASGLPAGLKLDRQSGQITGTLNSPGTFVVNLGAKNSAG